MMRKPVLRTYNRKNNDKLDFSTYPKPTLNFNSVEKETKEKKIFNETLEDPFDTTFDRLLKDVKTQPPLPPPNPDLSYISSSLEVSDNTASSKMLTANSKEDSVFSYKQPSPKKKPRLRKQSSNSDKPKKKATKPLKVVKEKAKKRSIKDNKKKTDEQKVKLPAKRKRRRISSSSENSSTDFILVKSKPKPIRESSSKENLSIDSNKSADFSFSHTPESVPNIPVDNELLTIEKVQNFVSNVEKLEERSHQFSSKEIVNFTESFNCKKSLHSKEDFNSIENFHSNKTDSVVSSKIIQHSSLKACSLVLKRCDWMLKKKENLLKLKPCLVKISRLNTRSVKKFKASVSQDLKEKTEYEPEAELENEVRKNISIEETSLKTSSLPELIDKKLQLNDSLVLKDCVVNLTRIKLPKNCSSGKLVSSTPFVRRTNGNLLLRGFSPMTLEISNIVPTSESSQTPSPAMESVITSRKASEPRLELEDINLKNSNYNTNLIAKPSEFNSEIWNASSDYSEIDWTTVSLSESQCVKATSLIEQQKTPIPANTSSQDLSLNKDLEPFSKPFEFVTKRNLDLIPEYEKSTSMFDDTKVSENEYVPGKLTPSKIDEESFKISPTMPLLRKMKDKSVIESSSILNQSEFKGFEGQTSPGMKKLSPMTAIPTSIVHSLSFEDLDKSLILKSEKSKHIRSLAFEKRYSEGKSPRKCLDFEEEPKICCENDSVSLNNKSVKDSLSKSFNSDSFSQNSFKDFLSQNSSNKDTLTQESLTEECNTFGSETKLTGKLKLDDSTNNSSYNLETSQPSQRTQSILIEDEKCPSEMKEERRKTLGVEEPILEEKAEEILEDKEEKVPETETVKTSEIKIRESIISLTRLKDPFGITHRRRKYRNWGLQLSAITENENRKSSENKVEIPLQVDEVKIDPVPEDSPSLCDTVSLASNASLINGKEVEVPEQPLFLKPGKSWARSLSILNNIHSKDDMDRLSIGKGKKWRNSVISILDMQSKGILQSCVKQQNDSKSPQKSGGALNGNSDYESQPQVERLSTFGSISPNRLVKRISIRVVPDVKKLDGVEDTQFLEAYGISSQSTKTLSQRFSSLEDNHTFLEPQETLIYNIHLEDSVIKTTDTPPPVTAKDVVLERCRQDDYLPFDECYPEKFLQHCRKIGEGVYGEVFLYDNGSDNSVIKIIPIEGNVNVNGEPQKKFHEILSEIVIAKELHDLRFGEKYNTAGFIEVKSIKCIIGRYPSKLVELWKAYDDEKKSENDCPSMFDENQLYISLELGHGGQDLEAFVFQNASESYAVFIQTAFALAVAEKSLEFEHRDLHWGNVLISRSRKSQVSYKLDDKEISIPSSGVKVAIIDFTLSRMSYQSCCIFNDLALDPALFTAEGEYQFEIYRLMRDRIENNWQKFEPFTNVLWLHYTLDKMIKLVRYKKKTTKVHKAAIEQLKELKDEILKYDSAFDLVTKCDKFTSLFNNVNTSALSS